MKYSIFTIIIAILGCNAVDAPSSGCDAIEADLDAAYSEQYNAEQDAEAGRAELAAVTAEKDEAYRLLLVRSTDAVSAFIAIPSGIAIPMCDDGKIADWLCAEYTRVHGTDIDPATNIEALNAYNDAILRDNEIAHEDADNAVALAAEQLSGCTERNSDLVRVIQAVPIDFVKCEIAPWVCEMHGVTE